MLTLNSYEKIEKISNLLGDIIEKSIGDRDGRNINRIERSMTRFVTLEWNKRATRAIKNALKVLNRTSKKQVTKAQGKLIVSKLESTFNGVENRSQNRLRRDLKSIYGQSRLKFVSKFGGTRRSQKNVKKQDEDERLRALTPAIALSFNIVDRATINQLANQHMIAIGDHFPGTLKRSVVKLIEEGVIAKGLNNRNAAKFLESELTRKLGGFVDAAPAAIRAQGQRAVSAYFEGLSATTVTRARAFGDILLMQQAEISKFIWISIVDNRTSQICLEMDGRVFEVDAGVKQMNGILGENTVTGVKNNFEWRRDLSEFNLSRGQKLTSPEASNLLASKGVPIVPPAHFRCRSEISPL